MKRIAKFEKVTFEQFVTDCRKCDITYDLNLMKRLYDEIELPVRKTKGSAGFDFATPMTRYFFKDCPTTFPTGIRCKMKPGWVLQLYPRSGLGFKYGMELMNTVGIIDSDYYYSDNEGHIMCKMLQKVEPHLVLPKGDSYMQGIFVQYGITKSDRCDGVRNGGFGSTGR